MKAYTLRLEENLLTLLKELSLKEKKSLRALILEAIEEKVSKRTSRIEDLKRRKLVERVARIASRVSDEQVVASIREDRER